MRWETIKFQRVNHRVAGLCLGVCLALMTRSVSAHDVCHPVLRVLGGYVDAIAAVQSGTVPASPDEARNIFTGLAAAGPYLEELNALTGWNFAPGDWSRMTTQAAATHLDANGFPHGDPSATSLPLHVTPRSSLGRFVEKMGRWGVQVKYRPADLSEETEAAYDYSTQEILPSNLAVATLRKTQAEAHEEGHAQLDHALRTKKPSLYHVRLDSLDGKPMWPDNPAAAVEGNSQYSRKQWGHELFADARLAMHLAAELRALRSQGVKADAPEIREKVEHLARYSRSIPAEQLAAICEQALVSLDRPNASFALTLWKGETDWILLRKDNVKISLPILDDSFNPLNPSEFLRRQMGEMKALSVALAEEKKHLREASDLFLSSPEKATDENINEVLRAAQAYHGVARRNLHSPSYLPR